MASSPAAEWEEPAEAHAGEVRKLSTLLEASQALSATLDLKESLQRVLEILGRHHGAIRSTVVLLNENTGDVELEAANRELEAFSYSVSHDLRAPLRHIGGFTKLLVDQHADQLDSHARHYLDRIQESARRMAALITDLLSLSSMTRMEMLRQSVDLSALCESIVADLRRAEPSRSVEVVLAPAVLVEGDPRLLRVALENLLNNSWKYTSQHPSARIEFGTRERDGGAVYFVHDDGAGFDMAHAGKLFGAFQRMHGVAEFEGTGIGLATVQRIVHRHGGRVWAESEVDAGAKFYFSLPVSK
jgi:light-regulated signal transduction histidine kinase (bacteriophytochrome)